MKRLKYSEKNLSLGHFVQHKSHIDWPGIELRSLSVLEFCTVSSSELKSKHFQWNELNVTHQLMHFQYNNILV